MKAKLAYLCSSTSWGGLEMNHLRNASWMLERGHSVAIICIKGSPVDVNAASFNLPIIYIAKHKKYYDFKQGKALFRLLKEHSFTHLLIRSTLDMSITAYVKRKFKDKLHTSYFMEMQLGVKKTNLMHTLRFKYIDLWSCPLKWLKEQVIELTHYKNKLIVTPSGMDLSQFNNLPSAEASRALLDLPTNTFLFGLIGRFDFQKGQLLLLEAMKLTNRSDYGVVLLGDPTVDEADQIMEKINTAVYDEGLKDRVFLRSFRKDAETFYNAVDWLVMATKAETFGMVTIESLACGTPVLGSNAGGTPEILENKRGGELFTSLDARDLALRIDSILDNQIEFDPNELKKMAVQYDHHAVCASVEQALGLTSK